MKIIYFVHCYPPAKGGLEFLSGEIVKMLRDLGHEVHVLTGKGMTLDSYKTFDNFVDESEDPEYVHRLPLKKEAQRWANKFLNKLIFLSGMFSPWYFGPILSYSKEMKELIKSADIIFGAGMPTKMFYDSYRFAKKYKKRLILHPSYHDVSYYKRSFLFQRVFDYSESVILQTNQEIRNIVSTYHISSSKITQMAYSPYNEKTINLAEATVSKEKRLLPKNITIGFVGQVTLRKNYNFFYSFLKYLEINDPEMFAAVNVIVAGIKTNSSLQVERLFSDYQNKIKFIYNFNDKSNIFKKIDVFVNPSTEESLGIVNFEAIQFKKPLIVHADSAFASLYTNNVNLLTYKGEKDLYSLLKSMLNKKVSKVLIYQLRFMKEYTKNSYQMKLKDLIHFQ